MILNSTQNTVLAHRVTVVDSFFSRLTGLLNRASLENGEALLITRCNCIHMFFMRFSIDVIFIDRKHSVVGIVENIQPFTLSPVFWSARTAIELPAGTIQTSRTALGDSLRIPLS